MNIKPCPFCGETPEVPDAYENQGSVYEIWCDCGRATVLVQISDLMSDAEVQDVDSWSDYALSYKKEYITRAKDAALRLWNERAGDVPTNDRGTSDGQSTQNDHRL